LSKELGERVIWHGRIFENLDSKHDDRIRSNDAAWSRFVLPCSGCGGNIRAGFASRRNVLSAIVLKHVLRASDFLRGVAMDREKNAAHFESSFVPLRLILRDA